MTGRARHGKPCGGPMPPPRRWRQCRDRMPAPCRLRPAQRPPAMIWKPGWTWQKNGRQSCSLRLGYHGCRLRRRHTAPMGYPRPAPNVDCVGGGIPAGAARGPAPLCLGGQCQTWACRNLPRLKKLDAMRFKGLADSLDSFMPPAHLTLCRVKALHGWIAHPRLFGQVCRCPAQQGPCGPNLFPVHSAPFDRNSCNTDRKAIDKLTIIDYR
jgi:hypothetical protein